MSFTQVELDTRNKALEEHRASRVRRTIDDILRDQCAPYLHLTRHQHSMLVNRERMRYEAEAIRKNKDRARDAKLKWQAAKVGLTARDRLLGKPS